MLIGTLATLPLLLSTYRDVSIPIVKLVCEAYRFSESGVVTVAGRNAHARTNYAVQPQSSSPQPQPELAHREKWLQTWEQELRLREERLVERERVVERKEAELRTRGKRGARRARTRRGAYKRDPD
jgi:hypothetical protein